jgi:replication factor A3
MSESTPRINASYLQAFSHRTVRLLGKVTELRGEAAQIDAGGRVDLHLNRVRFFPLATAFESQPGTSDTQEIVQVVAAHSAP